MANRKNIGSAKRKRYNLKYPREDKRGGKRRRSDKYNY